MSIEIALVGVAIAITVITGLAIRNALRGRPRRTSSDGSWSYSPYVDSGTSSFSSYSGSDDGSSNSGDTCSDASDSGASDGGGCDSGGDSGGGD